MFHIPSSAYSFATSPFREFMPPAPTNEAVEVSQPVSVSRRQDQFTGDYLRDDMAVFEIEGVLFRVPKCLFEPGPGKFKTLLFNEKEEDEGSDKAIISLPDLTADEFRALIDFFLPYRCLNRKEPSLQYWTDLLSISTKYQLESIRPVAIKGIDNYRQEIDPVEKYALATKYMVKEWEASSFKRLCQRADPLTVEEAKKLGVVVVTEVFREREKIRSKPDTTDEAQLPQPPVGSVNLPSGLGTTTAATDHGPGPSNASQSNQASTTSVETATAKPVTNPVGATSTSPDSTCFKPVSPKVKVEPSEEQDIFLNPQPAPSLFPPPASGKTTQVPSDQHRGNDSSPRLSESGDSKKPAPSGPASTISQGQGYTLFGGVGASFIVMPTEGQKTNKGIALPASASQSKFTFKQ